MRNIINCIPYLDKVADIICKWVKYVDLNTFDY